VPNDAGKQDLVKELIRAKKSLEVSKGDLRGAKVDLCTANERLVELEKSLNRVEEELARLHAFDGTAWAALAAPSPARTLSTRKSTASSTKVGVKFMFSPAKVRVVSHAAFMKLCVKLDVLDVLCETTFIH